SSFGAGWGDILVFKMSSTGNLVWARTFGGTDDEQPSSLAVTQHGGIAVAGRTMSSGAGSWDCVLFQLDSGGNYSDCAYACYPTVATPFLFTTLPAGLLDCVATEGSPGISSTTPGINVADVCPPAVEEDGSASGSDINCSLIPRAVLFISSSLSPLRIYYPDGRLAYSGRLERGENRINLDPGVYIWIVGPYRGKAVIR
ncbi:MAG: hypothetical protein ACPL68_06020, partial [Candidatus Hydrothermia bacterium]